MTKRLDVGFIKLHRVWLSHPLLQPGNKRTPVDPKRPVYSNYEAWGYLLNEAEFAERKIINKGLHQILLPGQLLAPQDTLAEVFNWTRCAVQRWLKSLERSGLVRSMSTETECGHTSATTQTRKPISKPIRKPIRKRTNTCTVLTIVNPEQINNARAVYKRPTDQRTDQRTDRNYKNKEYKNNNNYSSENFAIAPVASRSLPNGSSRHPELSDRERFPASDLRTTKLIDAIPKGWHTGASVCNGSASSDTPLKTPDPSSVRQGNGGHGDESKQT